MAAFPTIQELIPLELHHGTDPIPAEDPNAPFSVEYQHRKKLYEAYQVLKLRGFTVSEMTDYGCWDKPNAKRNNLDNPIHPLFQLPKWEEGDEKIGPGYAGNWEMRNPIIWDAMQPVLRLATQIFRRAGILPFVDALLTTMWQRVPYTQLQDGCPPGLHYSQAYSFRPRPPNIVNFGAKFLASQLTKLEQHIFLRIEPSENKPKDGFTSGYHTPYCHHVDPQQTRVYSKSRVNLTSQAILPLLENLSVTERLAHEFCVAKTLVHETMHLIAAYSAYIQQLPFGNAEPFFIDEEVSEVGRAWENSFFSGMLLPTNTDVVRGKEESFLGCQFSTWPPWEIYDTGTFDSSRTRQRFRSTKDFEPGGIRATTTFWPMQLVYFESIQQASFWGSCVPKYGNGLFMPLKVMGRRRARGGLTDKVMGSACAAFVDSQGKLIAEPAELPTNASEAEIWYREQVQITRAAVIKIRLRENRAAKERQKEGEREKADPGQRARREERDRLQEEEEINMLQVAFLTYSVEDEEVSRGLYGSLRGSRFARVRAEYFFVFGAFETGELVGKDEDWRTYMATLGTQELRLMDVLDPARAIIDTRKNKIIALRKGNNEKKRQKIDNAAAAASNANNASKKQKT